MKIKPTFSFLLVQLSDVPTKSNIILPDGQKRMPYGEVIDLGPDCKTFKLSDRIICLPDNLLGFEDSRGPVYLVNESAVVGTYETDEVVVMN